VEMVLPDVPKPFPDLKLSVQKKKFDAYLEEYEKYATLSEDWRIYAVAANGKMRWLRYLLSKNGKNAAKTQRDIKKLKRELEGYYKTIIKLKA